MCKVAYSGYVAPTVMFGKSFELRNISDKYLTARFFSLNSSKFVNQYIKYLADQQSRGSRVAFASLNTRSHDTLLSQKSLMSKLVQKEIQCFRIKDELASYMVIGRSAHRTGFGLK